MELDMLIDNLISVRDKLKTLGRHKNEVILSECGMRDTPCILVIPEEYETFDDVEFCTKEIESQLNISSDWNGNCIDIVMTERIGYR